MTRCHFCNEPVDPDYVYRRILGWERKAVAASRRGGSDIVLRQKIDEYACDRCVFRLQHDLSPMQEGLL